MIFDEAIRHGRYEHHPDQGQSTSSREPPGRDRFLSVEEFQLLLAKCRDPELRTASSCALHDDATAARAAEASVEPRCVLDGSAPFVSVPHTKTGVPKKTPLPRVAVEALKSLPSFGVDDSVFPLQGDGETAEPD